ncbi:MAG: error-prone DNA polymerase [Pseudomonadota bacterium]
MMDVSVNDRLGARAAHDAIDYADLMVTTNFSFLRGASHAEELVAQAAMLGHRAIAVCDHNTLAGVVRAHTAAKQAGLAFIVGARLVLRDAPDLLCFPSDRASYARLSRLLSLGQGRAEKGACHLWLDDVIAELAGQVIVVVPPEDWCWRDALNQPRRSHDPSSRSQARRGQVVDFPTGPSGECPPTTGAHPDTCAKSDHPGAHFADHLEDHSADQRGAPHPVARLTLEDTIKRLQHAAAHQETSPAGLYVALTYRHRGDDRARMNALHTLARTCAMPVIATNDVRYHTPHRRALHDVVTCIREGVKIKEAGCRLNPHAEYHLKAPAEMARLFADHREALQTISQVLRTCRFSLDELVYEYPDEPTPPGKTAQGYLEELAREGAAQRFPHGLDAKVETQLERELTLIGELNYAQYFLTVYDIVKFARSRGILCQGRGSAANSVVCYLLGITAVNPTEVDLLFDRFISPERKEPPDIDVDFEHERREEVIQYIFARYGRERAALAATVISYRTRSAVREVGKVMGLSEDTVSALAGMVWGFGSSANVLPEERVREAGLDPTDPLLARVVELTGELVGFPRHLSQHVGGFVLTRGPLTEVVPVGNAAMEDRTVIEWDKDDLDALGLLKVDVLALGMLSCIRKAFDLMALHHGERLTLARVPREDPRVYDMLCRADSLGVFQVESRAQMNMLPRLKPRTYYDLVIEVAIVRPGPIQGDMVHPYLRRRDGLEAEDYPSPGPAFGPPDELRQILGKTKGVPLFQEQAMRIAMVAAKFSGPEANQLRKAMATFRRRGTIGQLQEKMVERMAQRGYDRSFAERCFNQIKGFGEYGFPESHAASFAHLVYVSSWLKCHFPDVFCCALLNAQPMGFYAPAQIVRDARDHGVEIREVDVNASTWDCTLEPLRHTLAPAALGPPRAEALPQGTHCLPGVYPRTAVRLGLRQIDGLREDHAQRIAAARRNAPFSDIHDLWQRAGVPHATLERLAAADAFRSLGLDRRQALWEVKALARAPSLPLFAWNGTREGGDEPQVSLPQMALSEHVVNDYQTLRLSLKAHPLHFLRPWLQREGLRACDDLRKLGDGARVEVAGVVLVRQRPGSAKGVVFMTLEDETGVANTVVWPKVLERNRKVVMGARLVVIKGRIQRHEDIIHVVADRLEDRSDWLHALSEGAGEHTMEIPLARADEVVRPEPGSARGALSELRALRHHGDPHARERPSLPPSAHPVGQGQGQGPPGGRGPLGMGHGHARRHPRDERIIPKSRDFH